MVNVSPFISISAFSVSSWCISIFPPQWVFQCCHHLCYSVTIIHSARMYWEATRGSFSPALCLLSFSICAQAHITSRSHAAVARHGMQLIPVQGRGGAHRNDHHRIKLSAGLLWLCVWVSNRKSLELPKNATLCKWLSEVHAPTNHVTSGADLNGLTPSGPSRH